MHSGFVTIFKTGKSTPLTTGSRMLPAKSCGEWKISQLVFVSEPFELTNSPYISTIWHHSQVTMLPLPDARFSRHIGL